ncbi:hypothetical protein OUZ56_003722 [Daphnia magna]|uniref:Uncharacterized protein n=1 Tax=Daphnia magna TaxID=35525 RepID=A0ABR0A9J7_9CRUS|nr:hypothetical protein OUZ56_003722 [Daphnia magna]
MTAKFENDLAPETELLKQRYQKFIKASGQERWALQAANSTEEQFKQDYSPVAEVEEEMSISKNANWTLKPTAQIAAAPASGAAVAAP